MLSRGMLTGFKNEPHLMKFNKAKCEVLYMAQDNHQDQQGLEDAWLESSPMEKDLRILVGTNWT